jgi:hypothetical protein
MKKQLSRLVCKLFKKKSVSLSEFIVGSCKAFILLAFGWFGLVVIGCGFISILTKTFNMNILGITANDALMYNTLTLYQAFIGILFGILVVVSIVCIEFIGAWILCIIDSQFKKVKQKLDDIKVAECTNIK